MDERIVKIVGLAEKYLGRPYKYGVSPSEAPKFFDCSSFTQFLFKKIEIKIPRTALEQINIGKKIDKDDLRPGDLVFCKGSVGRYNANHPDGVGHVALYIGRNKIVHAKSVEKNKKEVGAVVIEDLDDFSKKGWRGGRRVF